MKRVVLLRLQSLKDRTLGKILVFDGITQQADFASLELPDRGNARNVSRIPAGEYRITPRTNAHYGDHFLVEDVPGRSWILFHAGNLPAHTEGCILVGMRHGDLDGDGIFDVLQSRTAMALLAQIVPEETDLHIVDCG